ncbi:Uma2 family endonuclease [Leptolyngbya sp. FACHB-261]|uniref:Uma2 family endonuclease n=1 Tax=Leptolyngbya sp. FACHB-261 TaxID=2692806 RepID=UPI001686A408|nr:Uma2 family endonuclease [Leptolyngbya sp. FACHB-261]MBD2102012.1 Uma2 family endonuclease [Leptolyngbya sp. FACHB-261]
MTTLTGQSFQIEYPEADGEPMAESDPARDYLIYGVEALDIYFQSRRNVYVSGNLFIYYQQGDPSAVVSPDVFVVFGVSKRKRRSYQLWREGNKAPAFVLEVTSRTTRKQDEEEKPKLYAQLGVQEYFQYDPVGDYLQPQLKGSRLIDGQYQAIETQTLSPPRMGMSEVISLHSQVLGLDLRLEEPGFAVAIGSAQAIAEMPRELRFYDPQTNEKLLSHRESEQARQLAEQAQAQAEQAQAQAEQAQIQAEQALQSEAQARRAAVPRLRAMGLNVEQIAQALELPVAEVERMASMGESDGNPVTS